MSTYVYMTGTGTPIPDGQRAGPGVFVHSHGVSLQFDCGRGTMMRLASCGLRPRTLTAVFLTHHHSDHMVALPDIALTRWTVADAHGLPYTPLQVIAPRGPASRYVERCLDVWKDDIEVRQEHTGMTDAPQINVGSFTATDTPQLVFVAEGVRVYAIAVEHDPVTPAVAYRVETRDGSVTISGDTQVCDAIKVLSKGSNILIHEALLSQGPGAEKCGLASYHSDCIELGHQLRKRKGQLLVLTHLLPLTKDEETENVFEAQVRQGGFKGCMVVARDHDIFSLPLENKFIYEHMKKVD